MYVREAAFVEDLDLFDAAFFGIASGEARAMDPQQRLLLETGFEALHGVGYSKESLVAEPVGVFVGSMCYNRGPSTCHTMQSPL